MNTNPDSLTVTPPVTVRGLKWGVSFAGTFCHTDDISVARETVAALEAVGYYVDSAKEDDPVYRFVFRNADGEQFTLVYIATLPCYRPHYEIACRDSVSHAYSRFGQGTYVVKSGAMTDFAVARAVHNYVVCRPTLRFSD